MRGRLAKPKSGSLDLRRTCPDLVQITLSTIFSALASEVRKSGHNHNKREVARVLLLRLPTSLSLFAFSVQTPDSTRKRLIHQRSKVWTSKETSSRLSARLLDLRLPPPATTSELPGRTRATLRDLEIDS